MSNNTEEKQYGLILPKKQQPVTKISNVFADSNDSDEEDGTDWVKKALKAEGEKNKMKKQTKLNMQKALKEDPTIFQYDEVYDEMEKAKDQSKAVKEEKKKPKYIQNLLKAAERRKKEQEYRIERMVQKEREAEGEMYADKESFVTSAYRAKLEEFKKMKEEEDQMDRLETIGDVRKQQDMSGFYRHLYEQTVKPSEESEIIDNNEESTLSQGTPNVSKETNAHVTKKEEIKSKEVKKNRQYRQRVIEEDSDTDAESQQKELDNKIKSPLPVKRHSTEKESEPAEPESKKTKQQIEISESNKTDNPVIAEDTSNSNNVEKEPNNDKDNDQPNAASITAKAKIEAERKERSKIWEKRTVGAIFEAALQRYYARKSMRLSIA